LWSYVSKSRNTSGGGNNMMGCTMCVISYNESYTLVRGHLLKINGED